MKKEIDLSKKTEAKKFDWWNMLKSISPQLITRGVKFLATKYGIGLTGIQGFLLGLLIKAGIRKADKAIEEGHDHSVDKDNIKKYKEVLSDDNATEEDKIRAETDLLNGREH